MTVDENKLFDPGAFASRLRELIFPEKLVPFSERAGISISVLNKYLAGNEGLNPSVEVVSRICRATRSSMDWLITGKGDSPVPEDGDTIRVPRYDVQFAGGAGTAIERENAIGDMPFDRGLLTSLGFENAEGLAVVTLKGDSMYPQIPDGGRVLLDLKDKQLTEGIFAFRLGDDLRIKRLRRVGIQGVEAISANPVYPPELIDASMMVHFQMIGRAVWAGTKL